MGKRLLSTPRSRVRSALRKLFLSSRERAAALKREGYRCQRCGAKQSKAKGHECKVEVHHINGLVWNLLLDLVYEHLLCDPAGLRVLCERCHEAEHEEVPF